MDFLEEILITRGCLVCGERHDSMKAHINCAHDLFKKASDNIVYSEEVLRKLIPELTGNPMFFAPDLWTAELFSTAVLPIQGMYFVPVLLELPEEFRDYFETAEIKARRILQAFIELGFRRDLPAELVKCRDVKELWDWGLEEVRKQVKREVEFLRDFPARLTEIKEWWRRNGKLSDNQIRALSWFRMLPSHMLDPTFLYAELTRDGLIYGVAERHADFVDAVEILFDPYDFEILSQRELEVF